MACSKIESVQENETNEIFLDFKIQRDNPIPTRRPDLALINKKEHVIKYIFP